MLACSEAASFETCTAGRKQCKLVLKVPIFREGSKRWVLPPAMQTVHLYQTDSLADVKDPIPERLSLLQWHVTDPPDSVDMPANSALCHCPVQDTRGAM